MQQPRAEFLLRVVKYTDGSGGEYKADTCKLKGTQKAFMLHTLSYLPTYSCFYKSQYINYIRIEVCFIHIICRVCVS